MYFDSHAHYDDGRFEREFDGGYKSAVAKARESGVDVIVNIGSNVRTSENSVALAHEYSFIYAAVGIHPSDAQEIPTDEVDASLRRIEELAGDERVRAIGEIGFDYHYDGTDKERQKYFFEAQLEIADRLSLPVCIHTRDAWGDVFPLLREYSLRCGRKLRENGEEAPLGVLHGYSGSTETAKQLCRLGWYVSFAGTVTYKNAREVKASAAAVPDDKLLIETDCPYLPPVPHRGEMNYSAYLCYISEAIAALRGITNEECAALTKKNGMRFYNIG